MRCITGPKAAMPQAGCGRGPHSSSNSSNRSGLSSGLLAPGGRHRQAAAAACAAGSGVGSACSSGCRPMRSRAAAAAAAAEPRQPPLRPARRAVAARARRDDEEGPPDWDREMSIFKQRTMAPNQLATLRELESKVNLGRVLWCSDSLAIMTGINPDAPLGTKLAFVSGGSGILLWHRSDNLAFAIVAGGASTITPGEGVECKIKGVLQVLDEARGPITRKEFELMQAPAGDSLYGAVVNYIGQPVPGVRTPANDAHLRRHEEARRQAAAPGAGQGGEQQQGKQQQQQPPPPPMMTSWEEEGGPDVAGSGVSALGLERLKALVNQQVAMKNREQVTESLFTGVKALDTLTPLGRGASLLVIGPNNSGKTTLALDAILGQRGSGVACVLACTTLTAEQLERRLQVLERAGCLQQTAVFFAPPDAPLGTKLATLMAAAAAGERVRDEGGHSLVVLDDLAPLSDSWDALVLALAGLGPERLREGLIKDEAGHDAELQPQTEQQLVDYEGMLVSGAVAQRRGFFSTLFLRAAKLHASFGGGSMTLLPLVPGRPATGTRAAAAVDMSKYQTLSEEQKDKLRQVLEKKQAAEAAVLALSVGPGELKTETVEEFISISDGQVVLDPGMSSPPGAEGGAGPVPYSVNPKLSVTRIGSRAYYKALEQLAPQIRLELAQAEDARRFAANQEDAVLQRYEARSRRIAAALEQQPASPVPLEELAVVLQALQGGHADAVPPREVPSFLEEGLAELRERDPKVLTDIAASKQLTAAAERGVARAFDAVLKRRAGQQQQQQREAGTE